MHLLKQSTTTTVLIGPVLDSAGSPYTSLSVTGLNLTKNGTTAALTTETLTHSHNGHYLLTLTTGNTDTIGRLVVSCNNTSYAMPTMRYEVLHANVFDAITGSTALSTHTAADVWAAATRVLTAGTNITLAKGTGVTGFNDPDAAANATAVWAAGTRSLTDKVGFQLASDGLDVISTTAPAGVASNFREMLVQVWRRFFRKATRSSTTLTTFADDGATTVTTQTISDDGNGNEVQGAAS